MRCSAILRQVRSVHHRERGTHRVFVQYFTLRIGEFGRSSRPSMHDVLMKLLLRSAQVRLVFLYAASSYVHTFRGSPTTGVGGSWSVNPTRVIGEIGGSRNGSCFCFALPLRANSQIGRRRSPWRTSSIPWARAGRMLPGSFLGRAKMCVRPSSGMAGTTMRCSSRTFLVLTIPD